MGRLFLLWMSANPKMCESCNIFKKLCNTFHYISNELYSIKIHSQFKKI